MRKFLPTESELIDRMAINQLKEVFIPEHKEQYAKEIDDIIHDLNDMELDGEFIRAVIVVAQMNLHIWHNESEARKGNNANENLLLTHGINGIRNTGKNKIQEMVSEVNGDEIVRKDHKTDCVAAEFKDWHISWTEHEDPTEISLELCTNMQNLTSEAPIRGRHGMGCKCGPWEPEKVG